MLKSYHEISIFKVDISWFTRRTPWTGSKCFSGPLPYHAMRNTPALRAQSQEAPIQKTRQPQTELRHQAPALQSARQPILRRREGLIGLQMQAGKVPVKALQIPLEHDPRQRP